MPPWPPLTPADWNHFHSGCSYFGSSSVNFIHSGSHAPSGFLLRPSIIRRSPSSPYIPRVPRTVSSRE